MLFRSGDKKAPPWQPRLLQVFKTVSMNAKDSNSWKNRYQAVITAKLHPQMGTVRWFTWKFEIPVNELCPVLSLIYKQDRKQKDQCNVSNIAPPDKFSVEPGPKSTSKKKSTGLNATNRNYLNQGAELYCKITTLHN